MRRRTVIAAAAAGLIVIGLAAAVMVRANAIAHAMLKKIEEQTGVKVTYAGIPGFVLWPKPAIVLWSVSIPAAARDNRQAFIEAGEMRLELDRNVFIPGHRTVINVHLFDARIDLTVNRDGKASWKFPARNDQSPDRTPSNLTVQIENGTVAFNDVRSNHTFLLENVNAGTTLAWPDGELTATGGLVWNRQPVRFNLYLKSPRRLAEDGSPIDLNISSPALTLALSGVAMTDDISGQATAKSPDLRLLASWLGTRLAGSRGFGKFDITGAIAVSQRAVTFNRAQFSLDGMRGQGDIAFTRQNGRAAIGANLGVDRIDFNAYRGPASSTSLPSFVEEGWPADTLSFAGLKEIDARLAIAANEVIYGDLKTGPAKVTAELNDGVLDLKLDNVSLYGGLAAAQLKFDGTQGTPALDIAFSGTGLEVHPALSAFLSFGKLSGKLSTSFTSTTSGSSVAEMISRLKGSGSLRITEGGIKNIDFIAIIRSATEVIQNGWPIDLAHATPFDALSASYTMEDGIVATQNLVLAAPNLALESHGEIDLARQTLDLTADPRIPTGGSDQSGAAEVATLPVPLVIKGPWIGPKFYPDMPGILDDPAAAFRALKKLGLGAANIEASPQLPAN